MHLYIYDYLLKRGFNASAQALNEEVGLGTQTTVPVEAQQGLLYEWWSVFWDVFSAGNPGKAGQTSGDAQAYIEVSPTFDPIPTTTSDDESFVRPPLCTHYIEPSTG